MNEERSESVPRIHIILLYTYASVYVVYRRRIISKYTDLMYYYNLPVSHNGYI